MGTFFQMAAFVAAGTVIINGIAVDSAEILKSAEYSANLLSKHNLEIALESYYLDNQSYPQVNDSKALIKELKQGRYIKNEPTDFSDFYYENYAQGQDYDLELKTPQS